MGEAVVRIDVEGSGNEDEARSLTEWLLRRTDLQVDSPPTILESYGLGPDFGTLTVRLSSITAAVQLIGQLMSWLNSRRDVVTVRITSASGVAAEFQSGTTLTTLEEVTQRIGPLLESVGLDRLTVGSAGFDILECEQDAPVVMLGGKSGFAQDGEEAEISGPTLPVTIYLSEER